jgi:hypothetical protein
MTDEPRESQYFLDMGNVVVRAGGRAKIHVQPRESFCLGRLMVLSESAPNFVVDELVVGRKVLWRGPAPAAEIVEPGVALVCTRPVTPSEFVTVSVVNTGSRDAVFRAVVTGRRLPGGSSPEAPIPLHLVGRTKNGGTSR